MKKVQGIIGLFCIQFMSWNLFAENAKIVNAQGGLRVRSEALATAKVVTLVPNKSKVIVLDETGDDLEISGKRGRWTRVRFKFIEGWAFGGYLREITAEEKIAFRTPKLRSGKEFEFDTDIYDSHKIGNLLILERFFDGPDGMFPLSQHYLFIRADNIWKPYKELFGVFENDIEKEGAPACHVTVLSSTQFKTECGCCSTMTRFTYTYQNENGISFLKKEEYVLDHLGNILPNKKK